MPTFDCDVCIVGAGPAGLCAAINLASEGRKVVIVDSGPEPGGQALKSSLIENYPGFPDGITGSDLMGNFLKQATKFHGEILCPERARALMRDGDRRIIMTDESEIGAKAVIVAAGLSYMRLYAENLPRFLGRGALYGAPTVDPLSLGECTICIVGGANSAGQAAMHMSKNPHAKVKMLVRKPIEDKMSNYLIERIHACGNIEVQVGVEVVGVDGSGLDLEQVSLKNVATGEITTMPTNHLFIFIGASPKTQWLDGSLTFDERRFILTGRHLEPDGWTVEDRQPFGFETCMPGVFACGDVRAFSIKRIAAAAGEGAAAVQMCHEYLGMLHA